MNDASTVTIPIASKRKQKPLRAVEGGLTPLKTVLKKLVLQQPAPPSGLLFSDSDEVLDRPAAAPNTGVNAENLKAAWATLAALRLEDLEPDPEDEEPPDVQEVWAALEADFADFKRWCRDPSFLRAINLDPALAVCWFVDVMLAANGDLFTDE